MVAVAEIPRPLGLILEEREDGRGVEIIRVDPRGNAALSRADVLVGDRVLMVGDAACGEGGFDEVAGLIGSSPDVVELTLGRALDVVRVEWPNGCVVGARPGDRMVDLAAKAGWGVRYSCTGGSCGTCREPRPTPSFRAETRVDPRRRAPAADGDGRALLAPLRRARPEERARRRRRPRRPVLRARARPSLALGVDVAGERVAVAVVGPRRGGRREVGPVEGQEEVEVEPARARRGALEEGHDAGVVREVRPRAAGGAAVHGRPRAVPAARRVRVLRRTFDRLLPRRALGRCDARHRRRRSPDHRDRVWPRGIA